MSNKFVESRIVVAVKRILTGRVNEILGETEYHIPAIEFGNIGGAYAVAPVIALSSCERSEKERIIRQDAYSLSITISFPESSESEMFCYAYSGAISRAFYDDPTLGGVVDRVAITGKKYITPKRSNCNEDWGLVVTVRVSVERMNNDG